MEDLGTYLRRVVVAYIECYGMKHSTFGVLSVGDSAFVTDLQRGRSPRLDTADKVLTFIGLPPVGPAFRNEVEAYIAVTKTKISELGRCATGNPSFINRLRRGALPRISTVDQVREWMAENSNEAEREKIASLVESWSNDRSD